MKENWHLFISSVNFALYPNIPPYNIPPFLYNWEISSFYYKHYELVFYWVV